MKLKTFPFIAYDGAETSGGGAPDAQPEPAAAESQPEAQPGPWAADLEAYFQDEATRAAADRYMREKVQPRITQLEQDSAPARALYKDLMENPYQTLYNVLAEIADEDTANKFAGLFEDDEDTPEEQPAVEQPAATEDIPEWAKPFVDYVTSQQEKQAQQESSSEYESWKQEFLGQEQHQDIDPELFDAFVAVADSAEDAVARYRAFAGRFQSGGEQEQPTPEAPAVLGGEGAPAAVPPVEEKYDSLDAALDAFVAEQRRGAPPVVGSA